MWRRRRVRQGAELATDCDAFLTGRYLEHLDSHSDPIPVWAWTNLLAHGNPEQLEAARRLLGSAKARDRSTRVWQDARAYLAGEVLDAADGDPALLQQLQARVLMPLELDLAESTVVLVSARMVVVAVIAALDDDRSEQRRHRTRRTDRPR